MRANLREWVRRALPASTRAALGNGVGRCRELMSKASLWRWSVTLLRGSPFDVVYIGRTALRGVACDLVTRSSRSEGAAAATSSNANTVVAPFTVGTTTPVLVRSTKINQALGSQIALRVTDVAGNVVDCDPLVAGEVAVPSAGGCSHRGLADSSPSWEWRPRAWCVAAGTSSPERAEEEQLRGRPQTACGRPAVPWHGTSDRWNECACVASREM
jgi:hypothetical protein